MSKLRQRMIEDLRIRNYAAKTIDSYIRYAGEFAKYCGKSPDQLGIEHIRDYQVFLVETKKASWAVFNQTVCALRFLYKVTLGRSEIIEHIPFPKQEKTLPVILALPTRNRPNPVAFHLFLKRFFVESIKFVHFLSHQIGSKGGHAG